MNGFVYVVRNSAGLLKIGYSNDPSRRLAMLRTSAADHLELLGVIPGTLDHERQLHEIFSRARVVREWFRYMPAMQPLLDGLRHYGEERGRILHDNWCRPAATIIDAFGGIDRVSEITGTHKSRVYQWMYPKNRGGTDGQIPHRKARSLLKYAKRHSIPVSAADFFDGSAA